MLMLFATTCCMLLDAFRPPVLPLGQLIAMPRRCLDLGQRSVRENEFLKERCLFQDSLLGVGLGF